MSPEKRFTEDEKVALRHAIEEAELNTSGEIRIHIENKCNKDPLDRATEVFDQLSMQKTALRNGVLVYVALDDKKLAILGDAGINAVVPDNFWDCVKKLMITHFQKGEIVLGISEAVKEVGVLLKKYFPYKEDDVNELSDDISFNKN